MSMNSQNPKNRSNGPGQALYYILSFVSLAAMALLWALDSAFIYVFGGIGLSLLLIGFSKGKREQQHQMPHVESRYRERTAKAAFGSSFLDDLEKKFSEQQNPNVNPGGDKKPMVAAFAIFSLFAFFIFLTFYLVFSGFGDDFESEDFLFTMAEQFRESGEYDSAALYYQKVLTENPEHFEAINGYATTLIQQNRSEDALKQLDRALEINPDFAYARYNKALVYYNQQKYKQSLQQSLDLIQRSPEYTAGILIAGDAYYTQQRYDSAIFYYEKAYDKGERSDVLCHLMAFIYDAKGNQSKAVLFYKEALSYDTAIVEIHKRLGELLPGKEGEPYRTYANANQ